MCAGSQTRWSYFKKTDFKVKQIVPIKGVPLLTLIQSQFPGATVVISDNEYKDKLIKYSHDILMLESTGSLVESLLMTFKLWSDCNIILLGDVLFSNHTIRQIKNCQDSLMFFGNSKEIFALVFTDKVRVIENCRYCLELGGGKLWDLYRVIEGIDIKEHRIDGDFTHTTGTRDFDCVLQYLDYLKCQKKKR